MTTIISVDVSTMKGFWIAWWLLSGTIAQVLRIGVQDPPGAMNLQLYASTFQDMQAKLGCPIEVVSFMQDSDLQQAAVNGSLQAMLAGPGVAYCTLLRTDMQPLASAITYLDGEPVNQLAGVVFTRRNSSIFKLQDLRGGIVAAGQVTQLVTCQAQWGLLQQHGVSLFADTRGVFFYTDLRALVEAVRGGVADAGFARAGFLEDLGYNASSFRILNSQTFPAFPYNSSTPLYSNSVLGTFPAVNYTMRTRLLRALLDYKPTDPPLVAGHYAGWASQQSFLDVRRLQVSIGVLTGDDSHCNQIDQVYDGVNCPPGQRRRSIAQVQDSCQSAGVVCPANTSMVQCVCSPCEAIVYPKRIAGLSVGRFVAIVAPVVWVILLVCCLVWRRLQLRVPAILWDDLHVDGSCILGKASHGLVLKGQYQGSAVAIKRAYPRAAPGKTLFDLDDAEIEKLLRPEVPLSDRACFKRWLHITRLTVECFGIQSWHQRQVRAVHQMASMRHSNIVPTLGVCLGEDRNEVLVVNQYMERGSLHELLNNPSVDIDKILTTSIARDVADAIHWCHLQSPPIVGCDLQAQHVLLDINLRAHLSTSSARGARESVYMAPELLQGHPRTPASDVYAFGMFVYSLLYRHDPFEGDDTKEVITAIRDSHSVTPKRPDISRVEEPIKQILEQCWDDDPAARPTLDEIRVGLQHSERRSMEAGRKSLADELLSRLRQGQVLIRAVYPPTVARALEEGRMPEPETYPFVTIFFSDIMGFTRISSKLGAEGVMAMLHMIYTAMDELAEKHRVFKVETIGDAWMGVTNLREPQADHAARMGRFALEVVNTVGSLVTPTSMTMSAEPLHIRVGIHSGPVTAGIVGSTNPRYCLFGDAVNVASRMESTCEQDKIQLSRQAAHAMVNHGPDLKPRIWRRAGLVDVKGKGMLKTYYLATDDDLVMLNVRRMRKRSATGPGEERFSYDEEALRETMR